MATDKERVQRGYQNPLQNVELSGLSGSTAGAVPGSGRDRRLNFRAVRIHNSHLQGGKSQAIGCGVCGKGLEGALPLVEKKQVPGAEVAQGDGVDQEEHAPPSSSRWDDIHR